jgi:hypothetical protein
LTNVLHFFSKSTKSFGFATSKHIGDTSSEHDGFWGLDYAPHSFVEPLVRGLKPQTLEWTHGQRGSGETDASTGAGKHLLYIRNL